MYYFSLYSVLEWTFFIHSGLFLIIFLHIHLRTGQFILSSSVHAPSVTTPSFFNFKLKTHLFTEIFLIDIFILVYQSLSTLLLLFRIFPFSVFLFYFIFHQFLTYQSFLKSNDKNDIYNNRLKNKKRSMRRLWRKRRLTLRQKWWQNTILMHQ